MIAFTITETDFGVAAVVVMVLAVLIYRLFRREPADRLVRLGVFIERARYRDADTHEVVPDDETTRIEWPKREESA